MFRPKTLQLRFTLFMILPVVFLLITMGFSALVYSRDLLLSQWREASILKLQRAAHHVDMRLARIKDLISLFHATSGAQYSESFHAWAIDHLSKQEGVVRVTVNWDTRENTDTRANSPNRATHRSDGESDRIAREQQFRGHHFDSDRIREITPPRYGADGEHGTFTLISDIHDKNGQIIGQLETVVNFYFIIQDVVESGWWQSSKAFLVDSRGQILICTVPGRFGKLSDSKDSLENETFTAMKAEPNGTVLGKGYSPGEVSGFYRLQEAPWSLVMIAPGNEILSPIVRFQLLFFILGTLSIAAIALLIRIVTVQTTSAIKRVSGSALKLSQGDFGEMLPISSQDEVGELTRSFNTMLVQLKDRMQMKQAINLAAEIQQNLLPQIIPNAPGFDIAARSIYSDETGGDFYDFLDIVGSAGETRLGIIVGDGSGHGVSAALLMTSVRAYLRCRVTIPGSLSETISDVNRLVVHDTQETGYFMTLFFAEIAPAERTLQWIRAGLDPALFYDPKTQKIEELIGKGVALGADDRYIYQENTINHLSLGQIILIGTDGIRETRNPAGEMFGSGRLATLLRQNASLPSNQIIESIFEAVLAFRDGETQEDDLTLVVLKVSD
jgi:sigma-B regulation protein RsbU (phosphoserine phosphatase)